MKLSSFHWILVSRYSVLLVLLAPVEYKLDYNAWCLFGEIEPFEPFTLKLILARLECIFH